MITAVIIDNEINSIIYLRTLIANKIPEIELLGEAMNVKSGLSLIQRTQPSLVFLDIELGSLTGFDLLNQIGKINFSIIFTTAHQHYALRAIKFSALDFLLKPVLAEDLAMAVIKAVKQKKDDFFLQKVNLLLENISEQTELKKIAIATSTHTLVIKIMDIIYLQSDGPGPYTSIYTRNGDKIVSSRILKEYEELLSEFEFCRIHRSSLINLTEINQYITKASCAHVIMSNDHKIDISDRKRNMLIDKLSSRFISF